MTMAIHAPPSSANIGLSRTVSSSANSDNIIPNPNATNSSSRQLQYGGSSAQSVILQTFADALDAEAAATLSASSEENVLRNNTNIIQPQKISFHGSSTTNTAVIISTKTMDSFEIEHSYQPPPPPQQQQPSRPPTPSLSQPLPVPQQQQQQQIQQPQAQMPIDSTYSSSSHNKKMSTQTTIDSSYSHSNSNISTNTEKSWVLHRLRWLRNPRGAARHKNSSKHDGDADDIININGGSSVSISAAPPYHGGTMEIDHHPPPQSRLSPSFKMTGGRRLRIGGRNNNKNKKKRLDGLLKTRRKQAVVIPNAINNTITVEGSSSSKSSKHPHASSSSSSSSDIHATSLPQYHHHQHPATPYQRITSWLTGSQTSRNNKFGNDIDDVEDTFSQLHDFDESEWTPHDSSYGAAIPVGGWIPKNIRRSIEFSLVTLAIVALVYAVVTTSIRLTEDHHHNNNSNSSTTTTTTNNNDQYITYDDDIIYNSTLAPSSSSSYTDDDAYNDESNNGN